MDLIVLAEGREERVQVSRTATGYRLTLGERSYEVDARSVDGSATLEVRSLILGGRHYEVAVRRDTTADQDGVYEVSCGGRLTAVEVVDPLTHLARSSLQKAGRRGPSRVTAYMPGRVAAILVEEGAEVTAGQGVLVLEAMKMENEIQADDDGVVRRIFVEAGQAVEGGDPLFEIE